MRSLKTLPVRYKGELHDVKLINFSVDKEEVLPLLPAELKLRLVNGRAMISMVDVQLRNMRPAFLPESMHFDYRHIAFRLLVDDSEWSHDLKGIYFLKSFTSNPLIAFGGNIISIYNLSRAGMEEKAGTLKLEQDNKYLHYTLSPTHVIKKDHWLKQVVGNIDRAYSVAGEQIAMVQIQREKWPLQWVHCSEFGTNFFETAQLEGAFIVDEVIHYEWMPPQWLGRPGENNSARKQAC